MIHELRAYDLKPGSGPDYLALFMQRGMGAVTRHLPMAGYWLTDSGALNRLYHLWIYADLAERAAARALLAADRDWNEGFVPRGFPLILRQQNVLMQLVEGSDAIAGAEAGRRRQHPDLPSDRPIFAETLQCLTAGRAGAAVRGGGSLIARWQVISGEAPGTEMALWQGGGLDVAARFDRHELLRPISCSPLQ